MTATPELDRQLEVINSGKAKVVQEFIDWLAGRDIHLAVYDPESRFGRMLPHEYDGMWEQLMADFFGIDRDKIEQERRALLDDIRRSNA